MIIHAMPVPAFALANSVNTDTILCAQAMINTPDAVPVIDWLLTAKFNPCAVPLTDEQGLLFHADSKKAMIKGFRKIFDAKGESEGYRLDAQGESLGLVFAAVDLQGYSNKLTGGAKIVKHNVSQFFTRQVTVASYYTRYATNRIVGVDKEDSRIAAKQKAQKTAHKFGGIEYYSSFSDLGSEPFARGFYLFVTRTKFVPLNHKGTSVVRMIGSTANYGTLATQISGKLEGNRGGVIGN